MVCRGGSVVAIVSALILGGCQIVPSSDTTAERLPVGTQTCATGNFIVGIDRYGNAICGLEPIDIGVIGGTEYNRDDVRKRMGLFGSGINVAIFGDSMKERHGRFFRRTAVDLFTAKVVTPPGPAPKRWVFSLYRNGICQIKCTIQGETATICNYTTATHCDGSACNKPNCAVCFEPGDRIWVEASPEDTVVPVTQLSWSARTLSYRPNDTTLCP